MSALVSNKFRAFPPTRIIMAVNADETIAVNVLVVSIYEFPSLKRKIECGRNQDATPSVVAVR